MLLLEVLGLVLSTLMLDALAAYNGNVSWKLGGLLFDVLPLGMKLSIDLQDDIERQQAVVRNLNIDGDKIIQQSSATDANILREQLEGLNSQWKEVCRQLAERKKRLCSGLGLWLCDFIQGPNSLGLPLASGSLHGIPGQSLTCPQSELWYQNLSSTQHEYL
ncbi:hypothetical protein L345_16528, partial [Ophiophagus hannah]